MINLDAPEPIFSQLIEQVKQAVAIDKLLPGAPMPSIRQLANDLDVNMKTVAKAYKLLERDEIIQSKGYRGSFVHPNAKQNCQFDLQAWLNETVAETIEVLRDRGVTDSEIRIAFTEQLKKRL